MEARTRSDSGAGDEAASLRASIERVNAENRKLRAQLELAEREAEHERREHRHRVEELAAASRRKSQAIAFLRAGLRQERRRNVLVHRNPLVRAYRWLRRRGHAR